jgi:alkyldihydroxyacetonephosphate synthase
MNERRRKFWGWGYEGDGITDAEAAAIGARLAAAFGADAIRDRQPPRVEDLDLRAPRV